MRASRACRSLEAWRWLRLPTMVSSANNR